ncbi:MAG: hypothetical protein PXX77_06660 [Gallionella sp.]|nr:hypothetical protein [Gallionella sp.]
MFELPSMWNIVVSTIVFFIAAWYFNRLLDEQGISKGMTRGLSVFVLAYLVSWGSGEFVDWVQGPQSKAEAVQDISQLLKQVGGAQP